MTTEQLYEEAIARAKLAAAEMCADPAAYGIDRKWRTVAEWIDYEFEGETGDWCRELVRQTGLPYWDIVKLITSAFKATVSLDELNAALPEESDT